MPPACAIEFLLYQLGASALLALDALPPEESAPAPLVSAEDETLEQAARSSRRAGAVNSEPRRMTFMGAFP